MSAQGSARRRRLPAARTDEQDTITAWRHVVAAFQRAGVAAAAKRRMRRRERRAGRREAQENR